MKKIICIILVVLINIFVFIQPAYSMRIFFKGDITPTNRAMFPQWVLPNWIQVMPSESESDWSVEIKITEEPASMAYNYRVGGHLVVWTLGWIALTPLWYFFTNEGTKDIYEIRLENLNTGEKKKFKKSVLGVRSAFYNRCMNLNGDFMGKRRPGISEIVDKSVFSYLRKYTKSEARKPKAPPKPSIVTISPDRITPGTTIIITGSNLNKNPVVKFNSINGDVTDVATDRLNVIVPQKVEVGDVKLQVKTEMGVTEVHHLNVISVEQYNKENYDEHYNKGITLLNSDNVNNWLKAADELEEAIKYINTLEAQEKLKEAQDKYNKEQARIKDEYNKEQERIKYNNEQYRLYYNKGMECLNSNDIYDWHKAPSEFKKAMTYGQNEDVKSKLREAEMKQNYAEHYIKGIKLLNSGGSENLRNAANEFKKALEYKNTPEAQQKMKEAQEKYKGSRTR